MFPLLSLPNELIDAVVAGIPNRASLVALARTCRKLQPFAEAQLYKNIYVRNGEQATNLSSALEKQPARFLLVERVESTPASEDWWGIEQMSDLVWHMPKLKELRVEHPLAYTVRETLCFKGMIAEYTDMFEMANDARVTEAPFRHMTSVTLHYIAQAYRYCKIQSIMPIFLSPTLKHIHISSVEFDDSSMSPESDARARHTPLETLVLERCTIRTNRLHAILSHPRALRSLTLNATMGDSVYLEKGPSKTAAFLNALQQQSHSLQHLCYRHILPTYKNAYLGWTDCIHGANRSETLPVLRSNSPGLSNFKRLETLDVGDRTSLMHALFDAELAPPALQSLIFTNLDFDYESTWKDLPSFISAVTAATSTSHLILHTRHTSRDFDTIRRFFAPTSLGYTPRGEALLRASEIMKQHNATVKLVCCENNGHYAPPYLYGEQRPEERVCFDSERLWNEGEDAALEMTPYYSTDQAGLQHG